MMYSSVAKGQLRNFIGSATHKVILAVAEDLIKQWYMSLPTGETEFHYMRDSLNRDGRIQGVDILLKELEKLASEQ